MMSTWKTAKIIRKITISMKCWKSLGLLACIFHIQFDSNYQKKNNNQKFHFGQFMQFWHKNQTKHQINSMNMFSANSHLWPNRKRLLVDQRHRRLQVRISKPPRLLWWRLQWHPHRWHLQCILLAHHVRPVNNYKHMSHFVASISKLHFNCFIFNSLYFLLYFFFKLICFFPLLQTKHNKTNNICSKFILFFSISVASIHKRINQKLLQLLEIRWPRIMSICQIMWHQMWRQHHWQPYQMWPVSQPFPCQQTILKSLNIRAISKHFENTPNH